MVNLITDHIDIWTSAQIQKNNGVGRRNSSANHGLHGIKKLRELILELAVRGKLVPQDPKDEPASVLLKKSISEKARLIKEGKLRKQEPLPEIADDEKLFDLPNGWVWSRLGDIGIIFNGNSINEKIKEEKYTGINGGLPFIATKDVGYGWDALDYNNGILIPENEPRFKVAHKGAVLICAEGGSAGKKCGITNQDICFGNKLFAIELYRNLESSYILANYLCPSFYSHFTQKMTGIIGGVSTTKFSQLLVPIPPAAEQCRIVAKVDELMALCDQLEQQQNDSNAAHQTLVETLLATLTSAANQDEFIEAWQRIANHFDLHFTTEHSIDQLKQTILQLAVMGKLVPQDPNDETASVLLKKIAAQKARLIKEGKIKKQEPVQEIREEEKPFELPFGWEWARPDDFSQKITDGEHFRPPTQDTGVYFLSAKDIRADGVSLDDPLYISEKTATEALKRCNPEKGDILIVSRGATVGRMCTVNIDDVFCLLGSVILIKPLQPMLSDYLKIVMKTPQAFEQLVSASGSTAQPAIYLRDFKKIIFPIAPLAEQQHIVVKVDGLMALCDTLKARISDAQTTQVQLADTIVEQAVA